MVFLGRVRLGFVSFVILLAATGTVFAQNAAIVGAVADESKAVLPGVTVTATDLNTGRQFVAVTGERGEYRLANVAAGRYKLQTELAGFANSVVPEFEVLVGQNLTMDFSMKVATLAETVTVSGAASLVDTQASRMAGNIDRRQVEMLPVQGRDWIQLSMMVKGVTVNSTPDKPVYKEGQFQLNLDGQQVTQLTCCSDNLKQPRLSKEAIGEYQIVTNLFDITQGRSQGMQVNAVTKSGTNAFTGSLFGNFRDDKFNSKDHLLNRVLPYSNQQVGGSFGGPIVHDKMHFFAVYEFEREPATQVVTPALWAPQTLTFPVTNIYPMILGRLDYQVGTKDHVTGRYQYSRVRNPIGNFSSNQYPSNFTQRNNLTWTGTVNWSRVLSNSLVQEVKYGYNKYRWNNLLADGVVPTTPTYGFPGATTGTGSDYIENNGYPLGLRYDLTGVSGTHDWKLGAEVQAYDNYGWFVTGFRGRFDFTSVPPDLARRFPLDAWNDPNRWDLTGLESSILRYSITMLPPDKKGPNNLYNGDWEYHTPYQEYGVWFGDNWKINSQLTVNFGVRYDLPWNIVSPRDITEKDIVINNGLFTENVGYKNGIQDLDNVAPRVGFAWDVTGRGDFVVRGGSGLFYGTVGSWPGLDYQIRNTVITAEFLYDGQPGFFQDPTRGVTAAQVFAGAVKLPAQAATVVNHDFKQPGMWQHMIGFQKQLNDVLGFDADLVYRRGFNEMGGRDPNVFADLANPGFNLDPRRFGRPAPAYGRVSLREMIGKSEDLELATSITRRYRDRFQIGATYTAMFFKNDDDSSVTFGVATSPPQAFDRSSSWGRAGDFQRHTFRMNGIYQLPWDVNVTGIFRYGSGNPLQINSGIDPLGYSVTRVRSNLSIVPRNSYDGDPVQALDIRLSKSVRIGPKVRIEGTAEVFNAYNAVTWGYNLIENSRSYGLHQSASQPRVMQFGARVTF